MNNLRKCVYCGNHSNMENRGLCNECYEQKEEGINASKCINDGCKGVGMEKFNFLCGSCYQKHMEARNPLVKLKQQDQMPYTMVISHVETVIIPK